MRCTDAMHYDSRLRDIMLEVAHSAIARTLLRGQPSTPQSVAYPASLTEPGASFVTLTTDDGTLRGCIGSLARTRPLIEDIHYNAYACAFRDPRFSPVSTAEYPHLTLALSILSVPEALQFADEQDLVAQLRPGIDGLIIGHGDNHATFLPSVWESLPAPMDFLRELKRKAGLAVQISVTHAARYTVESFASSPAQRADPIDIEDGHSTNN